jgi:hypothetical protein
VDVLMKSLTAIWQVALGALVLGAGLPALFALGLRSLYGRETVVATVGGGEPQVSRPTAMGRLGAILCFGIVIAAVLFGIVVIVFGKQIFGTS